MMSASRILRVILSGAAAGFLTLGLGGRAAMSGFAHFTVRPSVWTLGGSLSVAFSGAIAGAAAAVLYLLIGRWFLPRAPAIIRGLAFGALTLLVLSPGIRPPSPLTFALFAPAFLLYGVVFVAMVLRFQKREPTPLALGNAEVP